MARDTIRKLAEARADKVGIKGKMQREYFIRGYVEGQHDTLWNIVNLNKNDEVQ